MCGSTSGCAESPGWAAGAAASGARSARLTTALTSEVGVNAAMA
jgi:hypothetical protein